MKNSVENINFDTGAYRAKYTLKLALVCLCPGYATYDILGDFSLIMYLDTM